MRKLIFISLFSLLLLTPVAKADAFRYSSTMHEYAGGYVTSSRSHWTSCSINAGETVTVYIKITGYAADAKSSLRYAKVYASHKVGPYHDHSHSYHVAT